MSGNCEHESIDREPLRPSQSSAFWIGVDIGGTKTAVVLSQHLPRVDGRIEFPTSPCRGPEPALKQIADGIEELVAARGIDRRGFLGIGVSCGDPLDRIAGVIQEPPNLPGWINVSIKSFLEDRFGVICRLENDANASAVAEHAFGAGAGTRTMVFLTVGTGLGAGLILDNRLFRGCTGSAGEIGHVRLTRNGPVGYGKAGSIEGWASGGGISRLAMLKTKQAMERGERTALGPMLAEGALTAKHVADASRNGDSLARNILGTAARRLGEAMAVLVDVLNPECIVTGGITLRLGESFLDQARQTLRREALGRAADACRVVHAGLGERIGDVAALCIATGRCGD